MKAIVLEQLGNVVLKDEPDPVLQDSNEAIVRVTTAGICGSDLHIIHGRDPGIRMGTIMGHEFAGTVVDAGRDTGLTTGSRVLAPFTVNCGRCFFCNRGVTSRCENSIGFGFITEDGRGLHGGQAELVRVPFASSTLLQIPDSIRDEEILFLGDIFSTAYSCAENCSIQKGDVVVVIGCGPVGLLAVKASLLFQPSAVFAFDFVDYRLEKARQFGAIAVHPSAEDAWKAVAERTDGRGADAVVEAVGAPKALDLAISLARPGATIAIAGYHTEPVYELDILGAYRKNLTFKTGRCNARKYMQQLLPLIQRKSVSLTDLITHVLPLNEGVRGYDIFTNHRDHAIKVLLKP